MEIRWSRMDGTEYGCLAHNKLSRNVRCHLFALLPQASSCRHSSRGHSGSYCNRSKQWQNHTRLVGRAGVKSWCCSYSGLLQAHKESLCSYTKTDPISPLKMNDKQMPLPLCEGMCPRALAWQEGRLGKRSTGGFQAPLTTSSPSASPSPPQRTQKRHQRFWLL